MNASDAIRYLAHEAKLCRDRDGHEAFCLLLPGLCKVLDLRPADDFEALDFQKQFHDALRDLQRRNGGQWLPSYEKTHAA